MQNLEKEGDCSEAAIYLTMRAMDRFCKLHGRVPGGTRAVHDPAWEEDIDLLRQSLASLLGELGISVKDVPEELLVDCCRCAGSELHCVGAIMGGLAAQEVIKVIMHQFVPVVGTLVYNGAHSATAVLDV